MQLVKSPPATALSRHPPGASVAHARLGRLARPPQAPSDPAPHTGANLHDMPVPEPEDGEGSNRRKRRAAKTGKEIVAGSAGATAGILSGPFGVLVGPTVAVGTRRLLERFGVDRLFEDAGTQFANRTLGARQIERLELTYRTAATKLAEQLQAGGGLRTDGFFTLPGGEGETGPPAEEILEHLLEVSLDVAEKRKAERLGELFAFFAFRADVAPGHAHRLIEITRRLTYRQLLWLGGLRRERREHLPDWTPDGLFTVREMGVVGELLELAALQLVVRHDHRPITTFANINPAQLQTALDGSVLVEGMRLHMAEPEDWTELLDALRRLGTMDANDGASHTIEAHAMPGAEPGTLVPLGGHRLVRFTPLPAHVDEPEPPEEEHKDPD